MTFAPMDPSRGADGHRERCQDLTQVSCVAGAQLPPPCTFGAGDRYQTWRQGQDAALLRIVDTDKRFLALTLPTGAGKSLIYIAAGLAAGHRMAVLTATKALQTQLMNDFARAGLVDMRGQTNYPCVLLPNETVADGPCHHGYKCPEKDDGCLYYHAARIAQGSNLVVTNYAYWVSAHRAAERNKTGLPLGRFKILVLDEAHVAPDELSAMLEIQLPPRDLRLFDSHPFTENLKDWIDWAERARAKANRAYEAIKLAAASPHADWRTRRRATELRNLASDLTDLASAKGEWVVQRKEKYISFCPLWPAPYAESRLFLGVPKVVVTSATVRPKTLELLGVPEGDREIEDYRSTFPVSSRLVRHVPTVRMSHYSKAADIDKWIARIDEIIDGRLDRKGIVHTVSYERAAAVLRLSRHRSIMITHESGEAEDAVGRFRRLHAPAVLVSPSVTTGVDFPGSDCRYQIIAKIPFPTKCDRVVEARTSSDPEYGMYLAMQAIVQAAGRGVRSETDWCETFVIDDMWAWFWPQWRRFAPLWFHQAVTRSLAVPAPRSLD
jgi:ATP-dependent DNA helicase DinG